MKQFLIFISTMLLCLPGLNAVAASNDDAAVERWDFDVYLNDKKVGKHYFEVAEADGFKRVENEASFKYKILFIPAYRYEHTNTERWADNCLLGFDAETNANGKRMRASGERQEAGFKVVGEVGSLDLPECVMSFAYWNPAFLEQPRLLNPQSGEYLDVTVEELAPDILEVRGKPVTAVRYKLSAKKLDLTLWYSEDKEWLALESVAKGGNVIRYELS
ncbi:MAG: DUF6134 family protein [Gammaproteobacteria bacterium]|nr:DUF6134 family protein [Gammaproteobacteria bacterium]